MVIVEERGLECEIHEDETRLEQMSDFKYLGCILDDLGQILPNIIGRW